MCKWRSAKIRQLQQHDTTCSFVFQGVEYYGEADKLHMIHLSTLGLRYCWRFYSKDGRLIGTLGTPSITIPKAKLLHLLKKYTKTMHKTSSTLNKYTEN